MQELRFRPRLIPTLATLAGLVLFVNLGQWQAGKAQRVAAERAHFASQAVVCVTRIQAALVDAEQLRDAPIRVRGEFEPEGQFYVDNRQEDGQAGLHVVTPLKIEGSQTRILVNRGWVAWPGGSRKVLPSVPTPGAGVVEVQGIAALPVVKKFWLMPEHAEQWAQLWPRLDLPRFSAQVAYPVQAVVLLQTSGDANDGLVRRWPAPQDRGAQHQSYAFQWFGIALALALFYAYVSTRPRAAPDAAPVAAIARSEALGLAVHS
ncbi:MAG: SURF1 family protein, partial [Rhodoferax sp.]